MGEIREIHVTRLLMNKTKLMEWKNVFTTSDNIPTAIG